MADGAIFEQRGIQAAAIVTSPFTHTARIMARRYGYPDYRFAVMRHPIGNLKPDQIKERAREVLPEVLAILGIVDGAGGTPAGRR